MTYLFLGWLLGMATAFVLSLLEKPSVSDAARTLSSRAHQMKTRKAEVHAELKRAVGWRGR